MSKSLFLSLLVAIPCLGLASPAPCEEDWDRRLEIVTEPGQVASLRRECQESKQRRLDRWLGNFAKEDIRGMWLSSVRQFDTQLVVPRLRAMARGQESASVQGRMMVALLLLLEQDPVGLETIRALLGDPDPEIRKAALRAHWHLLRLPRSPAQVHRLYREQLDAEDPVLQRWAILACDRLGVEGVEERFHEMFVRLVQQPPAYPKDDRLYWLGRRLAENRDAVALDFLEEQALKLQSGQRRHDAGHLAKFVTHPDPAIRKRAWDLLEEMRRLDPNTAIGGSYAGIPALMLREGPARFLPTFEEWLSTESRLTT